MITIIERTIPKKKKCSVKVLSELIMKGRQLGDVLDTEVTISRAFIVVTSII